MSLVVESPTINVVGKKRGQGDGESTGSVYAHQMRAIMEMAVQQAEDQAQMRVFMARNSGGDRMQLPMPAGEAERTLSISIPKMAPGDDVEAFFQWPPAQWALCLLPLLTGDGLASAHAYRQHLARHTRSCAEHCGTASVSRRRATEGTSGRSHGRKAPSPSS